MKMLHVFTVDTTPKAFMKEYFELFSKSGFNISVLAGYQSDGWENISIPFVENFYRAPFARAVTILSFVKTIKFLYRFLKKHEFDIYVLHTPSSSFYMSLFRSLLKNKTVVFYCHGLVSYPKKTFKKKIIALFERVIFSKSDYCIFVSPSLAEFAILNNYVDSSKVLSYTGSISGVSSNEYTNEVFMDNSVLRLGYFGRVTYSKGILDCFEVVSILNKKGVRSDLYIGGSIENFDIQDQYIKNNKHIRYLGFFGKKEEFFKQIDILMVTSPREGFGMSALEANSFSIPVIGYNIVGLRDAVDNGQTGFLVDEVGDVNALVSQIQKYLVDSDLYYSHSKKAKSRAFDIFPQHKILDEQLSIFNRLVELKNQNA